jgi:hypothetical protein
MTHNVHIWLATAFFLASTILVGPASAAVGPQKPPTESAESPETLLTGCLKSHGADTAIAGPSGRLYTLEVVETVEAPAATTSTPTGTPPPGASKVTYSLSNEGKIDLEKHADHQVQLTGRMQAPSQAAQEKADRPGAPATRPEPGGAHRTFRVTGLKMIAAKCQ